MLPVTIHDIAKYSFIEKEPHEAGHDMSAQAILEQLKLDFDKLGTIQTVECVMLVHSHSVIHVLVLQETSSGRYRLPGGKKSELEDELSALQKHLRTFLGKPDKPYMGSSDTIDWNAIPSIEITRSFVDSVRSEMPKADPGPVSTDDIAFQLDDELQTREEADKVKRENSFLLGELIGEWIRPELELVLYPYCPPHVSTPKERKRVYLLQMPPSFTFVLPKNYRMLAVPIHELYGNSARFGSTVLSSIPAILSRFSFATK